MSEPESGEEVVVMGEGGGGSRNVMAMEDAPRCFAVFFILKQFFGGQGM